MSYLHYIVYVHNNILLKSLLKIDECAEDAKLLIDKWGWSVLHVATQANNSDAVDMILKIDMNQSLRVDTQQNTIFTVVNSITPNAKLRTAILKYFPD